MTQIVCPECDARMNDAGDFKAHMASEHPEEPARLGFGRTLPQ